MSTFVVVLAFYWELIHRANANLLFLILVSAITFSIALVCFIIAILMEPGYLKPKYDFMLEHIEPNFSLLLSAIAESADSTI